MAPVKAFRSELLPDGVLLLTIDVPGRRLNVLGKDLRQDLEAALSDVEGRSDARAVVVCSGKPGGFVAGADVREFTAIRSAQEGEDLSRSAQALLDRLAALPVPVVAAVHGPCLGAGVELILACGYRLATEDPRTRLGLPEVTLGLVPGAGGTQRLPRLVGLARGLELILTGRRLDGAAALEAGLVDEVVPKELLLAAARRAALGLAEGTLSPVRRGIRPAERLLRPLVFRRARAAVERAAGSSSPAALSAIEVVELGTAGSLAEGLAVEARHFGLLSVSSTSRALVSVFLASREARKDAGFPESVAVPEARKLGIVGAGDLGARIAAAAAGAGLAVRLMDTSHGALGRGLRQAREGLVGRRGRKGPTALELQGELDRLSPTLDLTGFRRCDLVLESVPEDLELKRRVLAEVEAATGEACVLGSGTSSLPVGEIGRDSRRPGRLLGMNFLPPVRETSLLEVVVTPATEPSATAAAVGLGRRLGRQVVVVRDGPGFYTTRVLVPCLDEAVRLVEEGVPAEDVDAAMVAFGFPAGPLAQLDDLGLGAAARASKVLAQAFGERFAAPASVVTLIEVGRTGRRSGRGFHLYAGGRRRADPDLRALLGGPPRRLLEARDVQDRLVFPFLNEAARCLQEGVLRSPRDGDLGAIFGLGFPPFLGGPFRYLDHLGARFAVEILERLAARHGERFRPAPILTDLARQERPFHA